MVKVGAVDADQHQSLGGQFGVRGFPTIKVFGANKKKPEDFNGARSAQGITDAGLKAAKDMVNARMGGKVSHELTTILPASADPTGQRRPVR